ncbi:MAG: TonB-dependent receptor [Saprospiraceae bacterium]|nr:TonB-dependent receptor [Saprospiraceae bacterium]
MLNKALNIFVRFSLLSISMITGYNSFGQTSDSLMKISGDSIFISAGRIPHLPERSSFAVSRLNHEIIQKGQQKISLIESLDYIPGVFTMNADNYAQDLRISIRGYGARSSFGIRGIKIIVDGVPETTPDGQGQVDNLDMNTIQSMEVMRGPSSGIYGNAAGGAILLQTDTGFTKNFTEISAGTGSFGFGNYHLKSGRKINKFSILLQGSHITTNGYRDHSEMRNTILNGKLKYDISPKESISFYVSHASSPTANDPGALTAPERDNNPQMAVPNNIKFLAGERLMQSKFAFNYQKKGLNNTEWQANLFYTFRDFENALPFVNGGIVSLKRHFPGGNLRFNRTVPIHDFIWKWSAGIDVELQDDLRLRFNNMDGKPGNEVFRQQETFLNSGVYMINALQASSSLEWTLGIRADFIRISAKVPDKSTEQIQYNRFNPTFGLNYRPGRNTYLFANFTTNFESPALIELSNNPSGTTGFNKNVNPQTSVNREVGMRMNIFKKLKAEMSVFYISISNEILPYELPEFPQRIFYRNAGKSRRIGMEAAATWTVSDRITGHFNYTLSDFQYTDYILNGENLNGNKPAGIPVHNLFTDWRYTSADRWFLILTGRYTSGIFVNDFNVLKDNAYVLFNLKAGATFKFKNFTLEPYGGLMNIGDERYSSNIRINAAGNRFFEPAPGRHFFAVVKVLF